MRLFKPSPPVYYPKYLKDFSHRCRCKQSYTLREAQILAPQFFKIAQESFNLVRTTIKPDIYFKRYDMTFCYLTELCKIEKVLKWKGKKPSDLLYDLLVHREELLFSFIMRVHSAACNKARTLKTPKAKENNIMKFVDFMNDIYCELPPWIIERMPQFLSSLRNIK